MRLFSQPHKQANTRLSSAGHSPDPSRLADAYTCFPTTPQPAQSSKPSVSRIGTANNLHLNLQTTRPRAHSQPTLVLYTAVLLGWAVQYITSNRGCACAYVYVYTPVCVRLCMHTCIQTNRQLGFSSATRTFFPHAHRDDARHEPDTAGSPILLACYSPLAL